MWSGFKFGFWYGGKYAAAHSPTFRLGGHLTISGAVPTPTSALLTETGGYLLTEDGFHILI